MTIQQVKSVFPTGKAAHPHDPETRNPAQAATWNGGKSNDQAEQRDLRQDSTRCQLLPSLLVFSEHRVDAPRTWLDLASFEDRKDTMASLDRLKRKIKIDARGCWNWQGYCDRNGYGRSSLNGLQGQAHRITYALAIGPIPEGMYLHHLCLNTGCCNPLHLEVVTPRENTRRNLSPPSCNGRKTRCDHGHPFDSENTYDHRGRRACRACNAEAVRRYKARKEGGAK